ncbi:GCN5-related N-acetyltransferase [Pseudomonas syringae pv. cilantro]|uniref:GCN5-related N-acetyltransferase n=1 Tax=Pseudomonas syringae pv. cilantro TaxID=81035 RepID=A0A0N1JNK4_PSESX|nr:GCN5-related N-acetyltransferase [Pseudomonas syringae pv. cilantro]KPW76673.1 GCN5-related N-acetyltransferase [Pseudomonas syringae pv. coriandricola]
MIQIRPMTPEDFDRFWPTFQAIVIAQETYAYDLALTQEQARNLWMKIFWIGGSSEIVVNLGL